MSPKNPLPTGTSLGKSYEYGIDIDLAGATATTPEWQQVRRASAIAPTFPEVTTDIATYDDLGAANEGVTGRSADLAFTVQANRLPTGEYLPEVEALIAASRGKMEGAMVHYRFYDKPEKGQPNPTDAGEAYGRVSVTRQNTDNSGVAIFAVTITGQGEFTPIANPWQGWPSSGEGTEPTP